MLLSVTEVLELTKFGFTWHDSLSTLHPGRLQSFHINKNINIDLIMKCIYCKSKIEFAGCLKVCFIYPTQQQSIQKRKKKKIKVSITYRNDTIPASYRKIYMVPAHTLLKTSFLLREILIRFDEWNAKHKRKVNSQALFGFTRLSTVVC